MSTPFHAHCDVPTAQSAASKVGPKHPQLVLLTTIFASSLAFVDSSVVNVGLPTIKESLGAGVADLQWIVNAYLLPLSALILLGGAAGDRFGRRQLLILGISLFAAASGLCAAAPNVSWILIGRFAQGLGAAMLLPNSLAILGQTFQGEAKGRAIGIWAGAGAAAGAVGPVLGGALIDVGAWRAIFLVNIPIAAFAIFLASTYVPADDRVGRHKLDSVGALLASVALGLITWGLTEGSTHRGWSPEAFAPVAAGIFAVATFIVFEKRRGASALVPIDMFGSASFAGLALFTLLLYAALGGLLVLLPFVLMEAAHYSSTAAGAALLPLPLILSVMSPIIGAVTGRVATRLPLRVGPLVVAIGFLLAMRIDQDGSYWSQVFPAVVTISFGLACAVAPLTTAVLEAVDDQHVGAASGLNSALARTGGLMATALIGPVLAAKGEALISTFQSALMAGAVLCVASSISTSVLNGRSP